MARDRARGALVASLLVMLLAAVALVGAERMVATSLATAERASVVDRAASLRAQLEMAVNRNVLLLRGMAAFLASHPDVSEAEFSAVARDLVTQGRHVRSMTFARGTVVTYVYPRVGNEAVIGADLSAQPEQRQATLRAIASRDVVVAGPVPGAEGSRTFFARMPVHLSPPEGEPRSGAFFGLVTLPLDAAALYREAGLDAGGNGLAVAIRGRDGLGAAGDSFFGNPLLFDADPVLLDVSLAGSGAWQLAVTPAEGWGASGSGTLWLVRILAAALTIAAGGLTWLHAIRAGERRAVEAELRRTATVDLATGAGNRTHFLRVGAAELARSRRFGHTFSVLVLRLHESGSGASAEAAAHAVLRAAASFGRQQLRAIDTVARIDTDTLAVLLPETPAAAADMVARRLARNFELVGVRWRDRTLVPHFAHAVTAVRQEDAAMEDVLMRAVASLSRPAVRAADAA